MESERSLDLRRFVDLSIDLLGVATLDGYFRDLGQAWEGALGFTREELYAKPYIDFVHPDDREDTLAQAEGLRRGEEAIRFENRYRCRDGSYRRLEWSASASLDEGLVY